MRDRGSEGLLDNPTFFPKPVAVSVRHYSG
jgi:hypothetical protein